MRHISIHLEDYRYPAQWKKYDHGEFRIWMRGTVFSGDRFTREEDIINQFQGLWELQTEGIINAAHSLLNHLNGFFAVVIENNQGVFAAVDRVRSIPLFYGQANGRIFLSDDGEWVRNNVGDRKMDPIARQEFLHTGYVTGSDTLFPKVKQLQAGELLHITKSHNEPQLQTHRYYRFLHHESDEPVDQEKLLSSLDAVSEKSVQRLIDYANGRQIVVPLSDGLDSRLILTLLRRFGYENVVTFSYGAPGNHGSRVSRAVAESLNYPWQFVEYSTSLWRTWWLSQEMRSYESYASQWTSLPHIQDWPAVWELKRSKKVDEYAVFAPGHSADLPAGSRSRIFPYLYDSNLMNLDHVMNALIKFHYSLQSLSKNNELFFRNRIFENFPITNHINQADAFEEWDVQERQAKFIINSIRAYEFWGYDWYLPFWDRDFMIFWQKVPIHMRKNKTLYDKYVYLAYRKQCVVLTEDSVFSKEMGKVVSASLRDAIKGSFLEPFLKPIYKFFKCFVDYYTHPLLWYGIQDIVTHMKVRPNNINSLLALLYIDQKKIDRLP
jgi:asparagine synthase (glutamine-hydrolysing)